MLARVELERGFRAQDLEIQFCSVVGHAHECAQGQVASVERDDVGRVEDEAIVKGRGGGAEEECGVGLWGGGVSGDFSGGDGIGVEG